MIAETLFDEVSQSVCEAAAANEYTRSQVMRTKAITLTAGTATLDDDVLTHYMCDAELLNLSNLSFHYAWRAYPDFVRRGDRRLGVFTLKGSTSLQVIDPNQPFASPLTATGSRALTVPCLVVKPTSASTELDADPQIISNLTEALSNALRGVTAKMAGEAV